MQASELLCVYPILAHYASTIGAKAENQLPVQAFLAVTLFMDMLLSIQHECVEAASLDTTAELILKLFKQNGWQAYLVKKFHWLFHYADSMLQHGFLIGTWAMERKHKQLTRIGSPIQNMQAYERSVLEEVVCSNAPAATAWHLRFFLSSHGSWQGHRCNATAVGSTSWKSGKY